MNFIINPKMIQMYCAFGTAILGMISAFAEIKQVDQRVDKRIDKKAEKEEES